MRTATFPRWTFSVLLAKAGFQELYIRRATTDFSLAAARQRPGRALYHDVNITT
jgi:hypothetical protein